MDYYDLQTSYFIDATQKPDRRSTSLDEIVSAPYLDVNTT